MTWKNLLLGFVDRVIFFGWFYDFYFAAKIMNISKKQSKITNIHDY